MAELPAKFSAIAIFGIIVLSAAFFWWYRRSLSMRAETPGKGDIGGEQGETEPQDKK